MIGPGSDKKSNSSNFSSPKDLDLILNERFTHSVQENLFINSICFPPSPLSTQGALNKQGTCAHWTKTSHFFGGIHFDIVDKSLPLYLFLLEQEQGTSAHSIVLKGLLSFFLQKCKSSFRAHSCSLSMNNLYNFFLKNVSSSILASIDSLQPLPLRLSPPKAWIEKRDMKGMFAL